MAHSGLNNATRAPHREQNIVIIIPAALLHRCDRVELTLTRVHQTEISLFGGVGHKIKIGSNNPLNRLERY